MDTLNLVASDMKPHIVLFPFMSKGHTIPLLDLAQLLINRHVMVTIFTTKANSPFISQFLANNKDVSIIDLPFPDQIDGIPQGIESTDKLPSISLFRPFTIATKLMKPHFEQALENIPCVSCIISDGFLTWTLESATKFDIPRISFYGSNCYWGVISREVNVNQLLSVPESDDDLITVTRFPWIKVTRNDFDEPFNRPYPTGPHLEFITANSYGLLVNSFYELEPLYVDYWNRESMPKAWCVGPLCMAESSPKVELSLCKNKKPKCVEWLDQKLAQGCPVLYIAFGSQAQLSTEQLKEIAKGLEKSKVNFFWVVRKYERSIFDELQKKVGERGMILAEWVNQREILRHESVKGFLSHCGWNSVLESICSGVPILAWPMMAEQPLNARMIVEEIKIGIRVETCDGTVKGFVKSEGLEKTIKELMEGERGREVRTKVKEVSQAAQEAMAKGGSSWRSLNELIDEVHTHRNSHAHGIPSLEGNKTSAKTKAEA